MSETANDFEGRRWIYGIWFIPHKDKPGQDMLMTIGRWEGKLRLEYRFRYPPGHPENQRTDGEDHKNWYYASMNDEPGNLNKGVAACLQVVENLRDTYGVAEFVRLECYNDDPKMMFELGSQPWAHMTLLPR